MSEERSDMPEVIWAGPVGHDCGNGKGQYTTDEHAYGGVTKYIRADHPVLIQCVEALRFYADKDNYDQMIDEGIGLAVSSIELDEGGFATKALAAFEKMKEGV